MEADIAAHEVCLYLVIHCYFSHVDLRALNIIKRLHVVNIILGECFFQDRITDLQSQTQHFAEVGHFDADSLQDKSRIIAERYDK